MWKDTYETLHRWTQIVGKIRLALTPMENHWWNTTLYVSPRGLTTSAMDYEGRLLQIDFNFIDHKLVIETTDGPVKSIQHAGLAAAGAGEDQCRLLRQRYGFELLVVEAGKERGCHW